MNEPKTKQNEMQRMTKYNNNHTHKLKREVKSINAWNHGCWRRRQRWRRWRQWWWWWWQDTSGGKTTIICFTCNIQFKYFTFCMAKKNWTHDRNNSQITTQRLAYIITMFQFRIWYLDWLSELLLYVYASFILKNDTGKHGSLRNVIYINTCIK